MKRVAVPPRQGWQKVVEEQGFLYHSLSGPYWSEDVAYSFSQREVDEIASATAELHRMCLEAVDYVISQGLLHLFGIPERFHAFIARSWEQQEPSVYGRFDLRYDGVSPPKMYEYNADTPTSLLEAGRIQDGWRRDQFKKCTQFNQLEDLLVGTWKRIAKRYPRVHFSSVSGNSEDLGNAHYMCSLAARAGIEATFLFVEEVFWDESQELFLDNDGSTIEAWFKLYPWEWIFEDRYAQHLMESPIAMIEPAWKVLMSSKVILPILWKLFPEHPNLLPAYFSADKLGSSFVRKPIYGREGANMMLVDGATVIETPGPYCALQHVYQALCPLPTFSNLHALVGSWVIGGKAAGIGIRESVGLISSNTSRFVPHVVEQWT